MPPKRAAAPTPQHDIATTPLPLTVRGAGPPGVGVGGTTGPTEVHATPSYSQHRVQQTNSHIALVIDDWVRFKGHHPIETQVGYDHNSAGNGQGQLIVAHNRDVAQGSNADLGTPARMVEMRVHAAELARSHDAKIQANLIPTDVEVAAAKLAAVSMGTRTSTNTDTAAEVTERHVMVSKFWAGKITTATGANNQHAELKVAGRLSAGRLRQEETDDIAGTKVRCNSCAAHLGTNTQLDTGLAGAQPVPFAGPLFPNTPAPQAPRAGATAVAPGNTHTGRGHTRARSMSPR